MFSSEEKWKQKDFKQHEFGSGASFSCIFHDIVDNRMKMKGLSSPGLLCCEERLTSLQWIQGESLQRIQRGIHPADPEGNS